MLLRLLCKDIIIRVYLYNSTGTRVCVFRVFQFPANFQVTGDLTR